MFNWFRRNSKEDQQESPDNIQNKEVESSAESELKTKEDYLAWAKAAYENIQVEKDAETSTEQESESDVSEEVASEEVVTQSPSVDEGVVEDGVEKEQSLESPSTSIEPDNLELDNPELDNPESDTDNQSSVVSESKLESETSEKLDPVDVSTKSQENIATISPTPTTNSPAWMQKSQGLEKLKESAIAEPEPEPEAKSADQTPALDENFLWSAQVLAEQGRSPEDVSAEEINWLTKLRQGLGKTRRGMIGQLKAIVGQGPLNKNAVEEIEELLLQADIGIDATDYIVETLQAKLKEEALPPDAAISYLKSILQDILDKPLQGQNNQDFFPEPGILNIWLLTGVNGAGKTTTIGKLTNLAKNAGYDCLIAAADTFRAAAVEQVKVWGTRTNTEVIANPGQNTDPAAVVYDAISAAKSRNTNLLLVDTAGRLQNKKNLMDELAKIRRVVSKNAPDAKIESLLVIDTTLGQNSLFQAQVFSEAAQLSGVVLTKLDGTAKGGVALAIAQQLNLPIRFIGVGEGIEDLRPFSSYEFVEALLDG